MYMVIYYTIMIFIIGLSLLLLSALFSGLTIGLMSLDLSDLRRMAHHGDTNALRILAIRKDSMLGIKYINEYPKSLKYLYIQT
jgi:CBS domain containing-hemolysin-like protein